MSDNPPRNCPPHPLPLARLLHLTPTLLGLLPVLLRPSFRLPTRFSPLAHPPPPLALRRIAFVVSLSNHTRLRRRPGHRLPASCLAPATPGPTRIHSSCPDSPQTERTSPSKASFRAIHHPRPIKHPDRNAKSFLEKTLTARESAHSAPRTAPRLAPRPGGPPHCHTAMPR